MATASGDAPAFLERFYDTFRAPPCRPSHPPLFARTPDVARFIEGLDVVLVGGGTLSMLGVWHAWDLPEQLRRAWEQGTVLASWSAGAMSVGSARARWRPDQGEGWLEIHQGRRVAHTMKLLRRAFELRSDCAS